MIHKVKSHPGPFQAVKGRLKKHEVRKFDRPYQVGDTVTLQEWDPDFADYSGQELSIRITHITQPGTFGLPADIGVFSFEIV